jgi:hypothetical protein
VLHSLRGRRSGRRLLGALALLLSLLAAPPAPGQTVTLPPAAPPDASRPNIVPQGADPQPTTPSGLGGPLAAGPRELTIRPRSSADSDYKSFTLPGDETAIVFTGGVILTVGSPADKKSLLDIEGDRLIVWTKGKTQDMVGKSKAQNVTGRAIEFYLSGNVELRYQGNDKETTVVRANEVYYDVNRSVAVAVQADLEVKDPKLPHSIHVKTPELHQLNAQTFQTDTAEVFSTVLPSDPGLEIQVRNVTIEEREVVRRNIFGLPYTDTITGQPKVEKQRYFKGYNMVTWLEGVPIFYFPYLAGDVQDPLGPLDALTFNANRIFGFQVYSTWDVFDLLGLYRPPGQRWRLFLDYLSERGPGVGTQYDYSGRSFFGAPAKVDGMFKAWGLRDRGKDIIGGSRGELAFNTLTDYQTVTHPDFRGRVLTRLNVQELPEGFTLQGQLGLISDRNFLEQYYLNEFFNEYNQDTWLYVKQQQGNWAWTGLGSVRLRDWVTETEWLPKADGWLLGQSLFDRLTYNAHASAGFARLKPTDVPPPPVSPTDVRVDTGRLDLWQDVSGDQLGRAYGGGGVRASVPFSRLYPTVQSDLFNLNGIFHKISLNGNYYASQSSTSYQNLPQLDRLNDDVSDLTIRQQRVFNPLLNPANAAFLTSPLFDPQQYAIRRLVWNRVDTLDTMNVFQMELDQRWQTKRGFPGSQHVVDWMVFDVRASLFPHSERDNYGNLFGIVEYNWIWNIGDRTALTSSGWLEPINNGPRAFNFGAVLNRPDNTSFYLGYRQVDPLRSRAVIGSLTYAFSPKYAMTASTVWDFGIQNQNYSLMLTRLGTDVQVSLGVSYNSILNNLGVNFEIVPILMRGTFRPATGTAIAGPGTMAATGSAR